MVFLIGGEEGRVTAGEKPGHSSPDRPGWLCRAGANSDDPKPEARSDLITRRAPIARVWGCQLTGVFDSVALRCNDIRRVAVVSIRISYSSSAGRTRNSRVEATTRSSPA